MLSTVAILISIYFTAIFFGGAHIWSQSVLILSTLVITVSVLVIWLVRKIRHPSIQSAIIIDPLSVMGIFFILVIAFQLVPISSEILQFVSFNTWDMWRPVVSESESVSAFPISLYPFITQVSIRFVCVALIVCWFILYGIKTRKQIRLIVNGLLVLGVFEALYGMVQLLPGYHVSLWWEKTYFTGVATGTFIDRNHLAGFLSMVICLGVGYFWAMMQEGKRSKNELNGSRYSRASRKLPSGGSRGVLYLLSIAVMLAGLLSTASRGGTLTVVISILFMVGLLATRMARRHTVFFPLVLVLIICSYVGYVASDRVVQRFGQFQSGFEGRISVMESTLEMAKDFPLTGIGLGAFQFVFPKYYATNLTMLIDYAHNDWAQLFAETGILGLGIVFTGFIWFIGLVMVRWRKRRDPLILGVGLGGMGALVAISIHSFSEFNLHMPANALVLAVILAITYKALYMHGGEGAEYFTYPSGKILLSRVGAGVLVLAVIAGALFVGKDAIALWRADAMARTFWNSTIPFKKPTNGELKEAWSLVPGNATYWAWAARRVYTDKDSNFELIKNTPYERADDPAFDLWKEALKRNPAYWHTWHTMGWAAFQRHSQNPGKRYPIALTALDRSVDLHPCDAQGHFVKGIVGIAAAHDGYLTDDHYWQDAFRGAIGRDPSYVEGVTNQILLYDDGDVYETLLAILPTRAAFYLTAARYCFMNDAVDTGLALLKKGEEKKEAEISRLWGDYVKNGGARTKEGAALLRDILYLDPKHPKALLEGEKVIEALKSQDRRYGRITDLADLTNLRWLLKDMQRRDESNVLPYYYQGRIEEESGNGNEAILLYRRSLSMNSQHFPTWIHLLDFMRNRVRTAGDTIEVESIERKIDLFSMDAIPASSWRLGSRQKDITTWSAPFRCEHSLAGVAIDFETEKGGAWELLADGRFVTAWKGAKAGNPGIGIPAGEHEMELVYFGTITELEKRQRPFDIQVGLKRW